MSAGKLHERPKVIKNQFKNFKASLWGSGKDGRLGNGKEMLEKLPVTIMT
jgi:hypothetical protein